MRLKSIASIAMLAGVCLAACSAGAALPSEISVRIKLAYNAFIIGERIRAEVNVENASADSIDVGSRGSEDSFFIELYRASDMSRLRRIGREPFTAAFLIHSGEGQKLETHLGDHFAIDAETRYLARAVLVHRGIRFESAYKSFDVVPGLRAGGALQMFAKAPGLRRELELVHWGRDQLEHLFLKARDTGPSGRRWTTADLGPVMRVTDPKLSILPSGEVVVLHRTSQDEFIRSVFWSIPEAFEVNEHERMTDPDVAGTERVKALYGESGSAETTQKKRSWWKFW